MGTVLNAIMGFCVGDALGVPAELELREEMKEDPVDDMLGYGTHAMPPGSWSDDSSMNLALVDSLAECRGLDVDDIMTRYLAWYQQGEYTPHGTSFGIGKTTRLALEHYDQKRNPHTSGRRGVRNNGNGALMRMLPLLFYLETVCTTEFGLVDFDRAAEIIDRVSGLTHGHPRSKIACHLYLQVASSLQGQAVTVREAVQNAMDNAFNYYETQHPELEVNFKRFGRLRNVETFMQLPESSIASTPYVVSTMESVLWCLLNTDNYQDCVLKAVNLGEDTDTIAAMAGGLAGIYYGYDSIPPSWIEQLARHDYIIALCTKLEQALEQMPRD